MYEKKILDAWCAVCVSYSGSYMAKPEKVQSDLLLMNIEALAAGEDYVPIQCIGTGTVDCPLGGKTKFVMIGYSFE